MKKKIKSVINKIEVVISVAFKSKCAELMKREGTLVSLLLDAVKQYWTDNGIKITNLENTNLAMKAVLDTVAPDGNKSQHARRKVVSTTLYRIRVQAGLPLNKSKSRKSNSKAVKVQAMSRSTVDIVTAINTLISKSACKSEVVAKLLETLKAL